MPIIWIVDDNIEYLAGHIDALKESGYSVITFTNTREPISRLNEGGKFDYALVDFKIGPDGGIIL